MPLMMTPRLEFVANMQRYNNQFPKDAPPPTKKPTHLKTQAPLTIFENKPKDDSKGNSTGFDFQLITQRQDW